MNCADVAPVLVSLLATVGFAVLGEWWWSHRARPAMVSRFEAHVRRLDVTEKG